MLTRKPNLKDKLYGSQVVIVPKKKSRIVQRAVASIKKLAKKNK